MASDVVALNTIAAAGSDSLLPTLTVNSDPNALVRAIAPIFSLVTANFTKNKNALRQRDMIASGLGYMALGL